MHAMTKLACLGLLLMLAACSTPPKPTVPSLTPETAAALLRYNSRAETWLIHVKKHSASCEYKVEVPDQTNHPTELDVSHIVYCGGTPAPLEYNATVSFAWDAQAQHWVITRFSS